MKIFLFLYRKILHVSPRSSASKMFVDNNILIIEALPWKEVFSFLLLYYLFSQIRLLERLKTVGSYCFETMCYCKQNAVMTSELIFFWNSKLYRILLQN